MPKWITYAGLIVAALALVPPVLIARARSAKSTRPRIHPIPDMDSQPKLKAQQLNALFADRRAMRRPPVGTVARGELRDDEHLYHGKVNRTWAKSFPFEITPEAMRRGQGRFNVFCAPCHGLDGGGRGAVAVRAEELEEGTWVPPLSAHSDQVRDRPPGHIFNTITHGIRTMPSYGRQIPVEDRWAIVAYVRALQRSRNARVEDVPVDLRPTLR